MGAFAPYDEVAVYTYSSTVSQVSDFAGASKIERAPESDEDGTWRQQWSAGVERSAGQRADYQRSAGGKSRPSPYIRRRKESHVLNDAILQAALDLRKRDRTRRKIIFVISDGREYRQQGQLQRC